MSARKTALTAIRQPVDLMAQSVWERLTARMGGETGPPVATRLAATLQVRDSVCARSREGTDSDPLAEASPRPAPDSKTAMH